MLIVVHGFSFRAVAVIAIPDPSDPPTSPLQSVLQGFGAGGSPEQGIFPYAHFVNGRTQLDMQN
jgi:hypothetical protein